MTIITNYQATVNESLQSTVGTRIENVESDEHTSMGFDIIVRATSNKTLDENAVVTISDGKYYFEDCCLESWNIKYCLDNDTSRFKWANKNGYGVIYYMKDNYCNEAYYDFKNIVYIVAGEPMFTFNDSLDSSDLSLVGRAKCNVINPSYLEGYANKAILTLNRNIFNSIEAEGNVTDAGLTNVDMDGDFHGCHISIAMHNNVIYGPRENEFIGYANDEGLQKQIDGLVYDLATTDLHLSTNMEFVGTTVNVIVTANCSQDAVMSIRENGGEPESSQSAVKAFSRTFSGVNNNKTFIAGYTVRGMEKPEKSTSITFVYPLYYGAADAYADLVNVSHRASKRASLAGTYNVIVQSTPTYIWFIIPHTMGTIRTAKMNGFEFSLNNPESVDINNVGYYVYRTPQKQEVQSYSITLA